MAKQPMARARGRRDKTRFPAWCGGLASRNGHRGAIALRDWRRRVGNYLFLRRAFRGLFAAGIGRHRYWNRSGPCADVPKAHAMICTIRSDESDRADEEAKTDVRPLGKASRRCRGR